jgi:uncharacterized RDD family membrane protein YckC
LPPQLVPQDAYAGLVSRLAALLTDVAVVTVAALAVSTLPSLAWEQVVLRAVPGWLTAGSAVAAALLPAAYFATCWWLTGQTAGGLLFGVAVQHRDRHALSFVQAAARAVVGLLLAPLWVIGMLGALRDNRRRAWHDRLFRTVVRYVGRR